MVRVKEHFEVKNDTQSFSNDTTYSWVSWYWFSLPRHKFRAWSMSLFAKSLSKDTTYSWVPWFWFGLSRHQFRAMTGVGRRS